MRNTKGNKRKSLGPLVLVAGLATALGLSGATAAVGGVSERYVENPPSFVIPVAINTAVTPLQIAQAMFANPALVTGAAYLAVPPAGTPNAVADAGTPLGGFPTAGATYGILTTGDANLAPTANCCTNSGANDAGGNVRGNTDYDVTILAIDFNVQDGNCLTVGDFRFLSEEFPEYVGTTYNDAFIAELDVSTWTTAGSAINAPNNFAFDPAGNPISINAAGVTSMTAGNAAGTTYDGATPLLQASTLVTPGAHTLYFSIFDQGDNIFDSAVFLDNIQFSNLPPEQCQEGAQPAPPEARATCEAYGLRILQTGALGNLESNYAYSTATTLATPGALLPPPAALGDAPAPPDAHADADVVDVDYAGVVAVDSRTVHSWCDVAGRYDPLTAAFTTHAYGWAGVEDLQLTVAGQTITLRAVDFEANAWGSSPGGVVFAIEGCNVVELDVVGLFGIPELDGCPPPNTALGVVPTVTVTLNEENPPIFVGGQWVYTGSAVHVQVVAAGTTTDVYVGYVSVAVTGDPPAFGPFWVPPGPCVVCAP